MLIMIFSALVSLALIPAVFAKVQFLGVAIAGGEFGCQIDGTCPPSSAQLPLSDGPSQMNHFVKDDGINVLRLPTTWQFLVNSQLGSDLDVSNLSKYDQLVQSCLNTGAYCMIDIHNFARWDGKIIGQGGPTDEQFARLWQQLAGKYAADDRIIFELMNEPHDLDVGVWAQTCQKAVTAIREAGATSQMILLPGTNFDSAATLISSGSADELLAIRNPDGSTDNLLLDIHKYLDDDNSGTHAACTTNNTDVFATVARYLRNKGRNGFISETGASSDASCMEAFCAQNTFINANSDVFRGLVAWGAGSFSTSYILSLTPSIQDGRPVDSALMRQCLLAPWNAAPGGGGTIPSPTSAIRGSTPTTASMTPALTPTLTHTSTLLSTPTVLLTASRNLPVVSAPNENDGSSTTTTSSSKSSKPALRTSNILVLTDVLTQSVATTLEIATGTPPARPGFGSLLTAGSSGPSPTSTPSPSPSPSPTRPSASETPSAPADGAGSVAVGALALWGCALVAAVSVAW